jgi:hypothetical protein
MRLAFLFVDADPVSIQQQAEASALQQAAAASSSQAPSSSGSGLLQRPGSAAAAAAGAPAGDDAAAAAAQVLLGVQLGPVGGLKPLQQVTDYDADFDLWFGALHRSSQSEGGAYMRMLVGIVLAPLVGSA